MNFLACFLPKIERKNSVILFTENLSQVNWLNPDDIERYSEQEKENNLQYFCKP